MEPNSFFAACDVTLSLCRLIIKFNCWLVVLTGSLCFLFGAINTEKLVLYANNCKNLIAGREWEKTEVQQMKFRNAFKSKITVSMERNLTRTSISISLSRSLPPCQHFSFDAFVLCFRGLIYQRCVKWFKSSFENLISKKKLHRK